MAAKFNFPSNIDWSKSDTQLGQELGCSVPTVGRERKRQGVSASHKHTRPDWTTADWTLSDDALAGKLGCSSTAVYNARKRNGAPAQPRKPRPLSEKAQREAKIAVALPEYEELAGYLDKQGVALSTKKGDSLTILERVRRLVATAKNG